MSNFVIKNRRSERAPYEFYGNVTVVRNILTPDSDPHLGLSLRAVV